MELTLSPESLEPEASFQTPSPPAHPIPSLSLFPLLPSPFPPLSPPPPARRPAVIPQAHHLAERSLGP